mmetsp:Transcript_16379/g.48818  ORF Transcript_16379/g.48818 Transcript_16379/m.48818 type:complete len:236 (+) Transcript_16379:610-1317(+)
MRTITSRTRSYGATCRKKGLPHAGLMETRWPHVDNSKVTPSPLAPGILRASSTISKNGRVSDAVEGLSDLPWKRRHCLGDGMDHLAWMRAITSATRSLRLTYTSNFRPALVLMETCLPSVSRSTVSPSRTPCCESGTNSVLRTTSDAGASARSDRPADNSGVAASSRTSGCPRKDKCCCSTGTPALTSISCIRWATKLCELMAKLHLLPAFVPTKICMSLGGPSNTIGPWGVSAT